MSTSFSPKPTDEYLLTLERAECSLVNFFKDADGALIEELEKLYNSITELKKKRTGTEDEQREEIRVYIMLASLAELLNLDTFADLNIDSLTKQHASSTETGRPHHRSRQNFSKQAQKILEEWIRAHPSAADCTKENKEELSRRTGLSFKQVSMWLINRRRRSPKS